MSAQGGGIDFTLGSEAAPNNLFAVKAGESISVQRGTSDSFLENVVLVLGLTTSGTAPFTIEVRFDQTSATTCPASVSVPKGTATLNANNDFTPISFVTPTTTGVYCLYVTVKDSATASKTVSRSRIAVDSSGTTKPTIDSSLEATETKGRLAFKRENGTLTLRGGITRAGQSLSVVRFVPKSGLEVDVALPPNGIRSGTDYWVQSTSDIDWPPLVICEDDTAPKPSDRCRIPEGEYASPKLRVLDSFGRVSSDATWTTSPTPTATAYGHLIVDYTKPTGSVVEPTGSVVRGELFTVKTMAKDTPLGAYKADTAVDIRVAVRVYDAGLTRQIPFYVEDQQDPFMEVTKPLVRYAGPSGVQGGVEQPFTVRVKIPVPTLNGGATDDWDRAAALANSTAGGIGYSQFKALSSFVAVAFPQDPAGNKPERVAEAPKSESILLGAVGPSITLRQQLNQQIAIGPPPAATVVGFPTSSCPQASPCIYKNGTKPAPSTSTPGASEYTPYKLTFELKNGGGISDTITLLARKTAGQSWPATLQVAGQAATPPSTSTTASQSVTLQAGETTTFVLTVTPPISAQATTGTNFTQWALEARSTRDSDSPVITSATRYELLPNAEFESFLQSGTAAEGRELNLTLRPLENPAAPLKFRIHNEGNVRATYTLPAPTSSKTGSNVPQCKNAEGSSEPTRNGIVVQYKQNGEQVFSVGVDPGQSITLDVALKVERLAAPTPATPQECKLGIIASPTGIGPAKDRVLRVTIPRDARLDMFEGRLTGSPSEENAKVARRIVRPGNEVSIPVRLINKGTAGLDLQLVLTPSVEGWQWVNEGSPNIATFSMDPGPNTIANKEIRISVPIQALSTDPGQAFNITAIDRTTGVSLNSMIAIVRIGAPGTITILRPGTQFLPTSTSEVTLPVSVATTLDFDTVPTARLDAVGTDCDGAISDYAATQTAARGASFGLRVKANFTGPSTWTLSDPSPGDTGAIVCGVSPSIAYVRPHIVSNNIDFAGDQVIALALGHCASGASGCATVGASANLIEPLDRKYKAGQPDGIVIDVSAPVTVETMGILAYEGTLDDGFQDFGCFLPAAEDCPTVATYRRFDMVPPPVLGYRGIPFFSSAAKRAIIETTGDVATTETSQAPKAFLTSMLISNPEGLRAGWNPIVFKVVDAGSPQSTAADAATLKVQLKVVGGDGGTRVLPSIDADNLGDGLFAVDLLVPPLESAPVVRLDIALTLSGQSQLGRQISGTAIVQHGIVLGATTVDGAASQVRSKTDGTTTTYYFDADSDSVINARDWVLGGTNAGGKQASAVTGTVRDPGAWDVWKHSAPNGQGVTYYLCKGCSAGAGPGTGGVTAIRLTPFKPVGATTSLAAWTLVKGSDADNVAGLSEIGALKFVRLGDEGTKLYVHDGTTLVRLTSLKLSSGSTTYDASTFAEDEAEDRFSENPEFANVCKEHALQNHKTVTTPGCPQGAAAKKPTPLPKDASRGVYREFVGSKDTVFVVAAPGTRACQVDTDAVVERCTGPGPQTVRVGAIQASIGTTSDTGKFTTTYSAYSGALLVVPHAAPNRAPSIPGLTSMALASDGGGWFQGTANFTAAGALYREWHLDLPGANTLHYSFFVDSSASRPQGMGQFPAFIEMTDDFPHFDNRAIPGFGIQNGDVTFDLVAVDGAALQRRAASSQFQILVTDAFPPELNATVPGSIEQGQQVEITAIAIDPAGVESVTGSLTISGGSPTPVTFTNVAGTDQWKGTISIATAGTAVLTITAEDSGNNLVTKSFTIQIGLNEPPRIALVSAHDTAGTRGFIKSGSPVVFSVTDASIESGTIGVFRLGGAAPPSPTDITDTDDALDLLIQGLGPSLGTGTKAVTIKVTKDAADVPDAKVWLNVTGASSTSDISADLTSATGTVTGSVGLPNAGSVTVEIDAVKGADTATHTFTIDVVESTGGRTPLTTGLVQSCVPSVCRVSVDPGITTGEAPLEVVARDGTAKRTNANFTIVVDGTVPTVTISAQNPKIPGDPVTVGPETAIQIDASDPAGGAGINGTLKVKVLRSGVVLGESDASPGTAIKLGQLGATTSGLIRVEALARDLVGNEFTGATNLQVDAQGPTLSGASVSEGAGVVVSVAADDESGIGGVSVNFRVGPTNPFQDRAMSASGDTFSTTITGLGGGVLEYYFEATDALGNLGTLRSRNDPLTFDLTGTGRVPLTVQIVRPASGSSVSGTRVEVEWAVSGGTGTADLVSATVTPAGGAPVALTPGTDPEVATFDSTLLPNGAATIVVRVGDGVDTPETPALQVTIDNLLTPRLDTPDPQPGEPLRVSFPVPVTNPTAVTVKVLDSDGGVVSEGAATKNTDGTWSYSFTPREAGRYTLQITATGDEGQRTFNTESFDVGGVAEKVRPLLPFVLVIALGAVVVIAAAYAAFGRWK